MATIRQEINLITNPTAGGDSNNVQIDTTKYSGSVSYYFEVVAKVDALTATYTLRRAGTVTDDATCTVTQTSYTRVRSTAFTPPAGATNYFAAESGGTNPLLWAARIVIIQTGTITDTRTQIEIGSEENVTSSTVAPFASPRYWLYTAANWNGSVSAYFESLIVSNSTKITATAQLQVDDGAFGAWSNVTGGSVTSSTGAAELKRTAAVTLSDGKHYRFSGSTSNSKSSVAFFGAKIIMDQTGSPSKLEPQYLVGNHKLTATGVASNQTLWDTTEWSGVTNTYEHAQDAIGATANAKLRDITDAADITGSSLTGANQQVSGTLTMPTTGHEIDTSVVAIGTEVDASRILVICSIDAVAVTVNQLAALGAG